MNISTFCAHLYKSDILPQLSSHPALPRPPEHTSQLTKHSTGYDLVPHLSINTSAGFLTVVLSAGQELAGSRVTSLPSNSSTLGVGNLLLKKKMPSQLQIIQKSSRPDCYNSGKTFLQQTAFQITKALCVIFSSLLIYTAFDD